MQVSGNTIKEYVNNAPEHQKAAIQKLLNILTKKLPKGFEKTMSYGMPSFVVPHSIYPNGYHCKPEEPVPFISIGAQKKHIGFYHMGIYAIPELLNWFTTEFPKHSSLKLDMGKSCIRFKNPEKIPFELLEELASKITPTQWIGIYEKSLKK